MAKKIFISLFLAALVVNVVFQCKRTMSVPPQGPGFMLGEVVKLWHPKKVTVKDGFVFRYNLWDKYDTAIYYQTGPDTFEVTTTFKKYVPNKPALPDIITSTDDNTLTGAQSYYPTASAGDNIYAPSGWSHFKDQQWNAPHYNKTGSFADNPVGGVAYVELTCDPCYKFEWWTEKRINHGIATVQIDGGAAVDVDLYDPRDDNNSLLVFTSPTLTNAKHSIKVNYTGRKNSLATQTNLLHDKFVTYRKQ